MRMPYLGDPHLPEVARLHNQLRQKYYTRLSEVRRTRANIAWRRLKTTHTIPEIFGLLIRNPNISY